MHPSKTKRFIQPGLGFIICPCEQNAGTVTFRVQQLDVRVETKTKDNVFLTAVVSVQYQVIRENVYQAFYSLTNTAQQITAHVYDVMRSQLPTLELDAVFEAKEDLALAVKNALQESMSTLFVLMDEISQLPILTIHSSYFKVPMDFRFFKLSLLILTLIIV